MSKELIVSSTAHETKVAILEDDELVEIYFEREKQYGLAGSIYKGRVTRLLPGMQSAFVNIGLERDAFLYVSDFFEDNEEYDRIVTKVEEKIVRMEEKGAISAEALVGTVQPAGGDGGAPAAEEVEIVPSEPAVVSRREETVPDRRDRRGGRRGRRRRMHGGRGFPESKYASGAETAPAPPAQPLTPAPETVEGGGESDFEVLPGESLAKYGLPSKAEEAPEKTPETDVLERAVEERFAPGKAIEEFQLDSVSVESSPAAAALESEAVPEPKAVEPPSVEEPAPSSAEAEALQSPEVEEPAAAEALDQPAVSAEPSTAAEQSAESEAPAPEAGREREIGVRERPYGPRYLHRSSRRPRGRDGRPDREQQAPEREGESARSATAEPALAPAGEASITDLLKEGQEIIVQMAKEPIGKKGARITSHLALPGRYLVYMPTVDHVGVSRRIQSEEERWRLKRIVQTHRTGMPGGFIVRTAGEGQDEEEIHQDMLFLYNLWLDMRQKAERKPAPLLVHHDLDLVERILRDQLTEAFKTIWVDSPEEYERILHFVERFQPALVSRVKLYTRSAPIFDEFGITPELEKALRPKIWLKSGGYIVINQTEALVAIDVNTGKFVGKSNRLEDTIVKTNIDAIKEIVRQIRLRDLGGIIVVDFIDMDERKNRQKVMQALEEALQRDRSPSKILQFNDFGLVAITRKRVKQSLERALCDLCPYCDGSGFVKSVSTMIMEILTEARKIAGTVEARNVVLRVNPEVAKALKSRDTSYLEELEATLGRPVLVKNDPQLHQERFDFN